MSSDYVRAGLHQDFVAAFQGRSAEILGSEVAGLEHGAHGAIEHEDAGIQGIV